jgi:hypothetical protein
MGGTAFGGARFGLFGCRRLSSDGSYIATEFFCILLVPMVPIKTLRVTPAPGQSRFPFVRKKFVRVIRLPLDISQVISVYLTAIVAIAYGLSFFEFGVPWLKRHLTLMDNGWLEILAFTAWMALPWFLIQSVRNRAMENASKDIRELNTPKPIDR